MCSGVSLFIPMLRIRFFIIPGPKIPHSRFGAGSESGTFGQGVVKNFFLPRGPKVPLSLPAPNRECCIFGLTRQKNRILTVGANKECLRSHVCHPSRRRGWQFPRDLGHSLLLLPWCVIYYCYTRFFYLTRRGSGAEMERDCDVRHKMVSSLS